MKELVKINYNNKDFIGYVDSICSSENTIGFNTAPKGNYTVNLLDKDTSVEINKITINSLSDIVPYIDSGEDKEVN